MWATNIETVKVRGTKKKQKQTHELKLHPCIDTSQNTVVKFVSIQDNAIGVWLRELLLLPVLLLSDCACMTMLQLKKKEISLLLLVFIKQ